MSFRLSLICALGCAILFFSTVVTADNWPSFRGSSDGFVAESDIPTEFGPGNHEAWSIDLPRGHSSPTVWNGTVYLTAHTPKTNTLHVYALDGETGAESWHKEISVNEVENFIHPDGSAAASSIATNGTHVIAYFASSGIYCFNADGEQLWHFPMETARSYSGASSSPIIHNNIVYVQRVASGSTFVVAINFNTGKQIWRHDFPVLGRLGSKSGAATVRATDKELIVHNTTGVSAHDLKTGEIIWSVRAATTATSSLVLTDTHVYAATYVQTGEEALRPDLPAWETLLKSTDKDNDQNVSAAEFPRELFWFRRPEGEASPQSSPRIRINHVDFNKDGKVGEQEWNGFKKRFESNRENVTDHGLLAIQLGGKGDVTKTHMTVVEKQGLPEVPSPVIGNSHLFMIKNGGILTCIDIKANKRLYRQRLGTTGTHFASPVLTGNLLIVCDGTGQIMIADVSGDRPKVVSKTLLDDRVFATPTVVDDTLYIRTESKLYAFRK